MHVDLMMATQFTFMASIMFAYMHYKFGVGTDTFKAGQYPTTLRLSIGV